MTIHSTPNERMLWVTTTRAIAKKALKLFDGYRGQGGYIVIGRIPNSKSFDCYHVNNYTERASYQKMIMRKKDNVEKFFLVDLSSSESEKLVILRLDLRDEIWWKDNPEYDPDYRLDRLEMMIWRSVDFTNWRNRNE